MLPFVVKDNYLAFGAPTTAASKMLENFYAPLQATAVEKLEAEVSAILNEIEAIKDDDETSPGTIDDITIFKVDDSFKFNVEVTEKVITTSTVKLEQKNKRIISPLKEVAAIRLSLGQPKVRPPISLPEEGSDE